MGAAMVEAWLYICAAGKPELTTNGGRWLTAAQHLGGIHTGCAVSGVIWLTLRTVHVFVNHDVYPGVLLAWAVIANLTLFITMVSGFPWLRNSHHKYDSSSSHVPAF